MPGESSSETENPYGRMHVTEPVRATIPVQNGARLSWDPWIIDILFQTNDVRLSWPPPPSKRTHTLNAYRHPWKKLFADQEIKVLSTRCGLDRTSFLEERALDGRTGRHGGIRARCRGRRCGQWGRSESVRRRSVGWRRWLGTGRDGNLPSRRALRLLCHHVYLVDAPPHVSGIRAHLPPLVLRLVDSDGASSRVDSTEGVDKLTVQGLISRPHLRFSIDRLGLEGLPREGCLNRPLRRSLKRQLTSRKLCKTTLTLHSVCTYGPSLLHSTPAGVDLRTRSACQHQRLKIKLVDHGRGWPRPDVPASGRIGAAGARCWARPRDRRVQSKKNLMPIFLPNEQAPTPPPPPNEHRSFEKKCR